MNLPDLPPAAGLLVPSGAVLAFPSVPTEAVRVRRARAGTLVALGDRRPGGAPRLRRAAARLGVRVDAEYVLLPGWRSASFVTSDDGDALAWVVQTFLTTPPGITRAHPAVDAASALARRAVTGRRGAAAVRVLVRWVAPGHLLIGTRT